MRILQFIGTCSNRQIGEFAEKKGRKASWNNAKKAIMNFSPDLYNQLSLNLRTYYEGHTQIIRGNINGCEGRYLHIVHSAVDYIFLLEQ